MGFNSDFIHLLGRDEIAQVDSFRKAKNTAVLAILFSDIEHSTSAAEQLGEQAFTTMRRLHDKLFVETMTRDNSGRIIKEIGDSFLCVFSEPSTAVERAVEFQQAISEHRDALSNEGYSLKVRVGIHFGQVAIENDIAIDIFGQHVNRAARIQSIAEGGKCLPQNPFGKMQADGSNKWGRVL